MPTDPDDLWPESIREPLTITPLSILKAQAIRLGRKTDHLVEAEVQSFADKGWINHSLRLVVPSLGDYSFEVLKVAQNPAAQPFSVTIWSRQGQSSKVDNQEAFKAVIKQIFASADVVNMIRSLIATQADTGDHDGDFTPLAETGPLGPAPQAVDDEDVAGPAIEPPTEPAPGAADS